MEIGSIKIQAKIEQADYVSYVWRANISKPMILLTILGGVVVLGIGIFGIIRSSSDSMAYFNVYLGLVFTVLYPIRIPFRARKMYRESARLSEPATYEITPDKVTVTGESYTSEFDWEKFHKIGEMKDWILLYHNRIVAELLPKKSFTSDQLTAFRQMVNSKPGVTSKLWS